MRVAVAGATGVLGRAVLARLADARHATVALVRSEAGARTARALGAEPVTGDLVTGEGLETLVSDTDVAIHLATAVPADGADWSANDRVRREGVANLLAAAEQAGVARYVQKSVAFLQPGTPADAWTGENTTAVSSPVLQSAADMEERVAASPLDWRILRGGLLYGPGTGLDDAWRRAARAGDLRLPGEGADYVSLVHVDDLADAVVLAATTHEGRFTATVCDDEPMRWRDLLGLVAALDDAPPPKPGGPVLLPSVRARNDAAKARLCWCPFHPTARSGLAPAAAGRAERATHRGPAT